jgi:hypothetical protein
MLENVDEFRCIWLENKNLNCRRLKVKYTIDIQATATYADKYNEPCEYMNGYANIDMVKCIFRLILIYRRCFI